MTGFLALLDKPAVAPGDSSWKVINMEIPGIGTVTKHEQFDWYYGEPMEISILGIRDGRIIVERYDSDPNKAELHMAISNFLSAGESALKDAEPFIYQYYKSCDDWYPDDEEWVNIELASDVWNYVQLGREPMVSRRAYGDKAVYISLECECDWEPEHGLQIVFKNGLRINKVGPYDGHLTNADAFDNKDLEDVIFVEM